MIHLNSFILGIVSITFLMLIIYVVVGMVKIKNLINSNRAFEAQFTSIFNEFSKLENDFNGHLVMVDKNNNEHINNVERDLNEKFKSIMSELDSKFDKLNNKINNQIK